MLAKKIRFQLSLNTCQGCHAGETKTNFTQMIPRGYGDSANYWGPVPDYVTSNNNYTSQQSGTSIDPRFTVSGMGSETVKNIGFTYDYYLQTAVRNVDSSLKLTNTTNQILSPFLTGRLYSSATANHWEDDELDELNDGGSVSNPVNIMSDNKINGLYYVNDPSNDYATRPPNCILPRGQGGVYPQLHDMKHGFNDLERRKKFICDLIRSNCVSGISPLAEQLVAMNQIPLPSSGH